MKRRIPESYTVMIVRTAKTPQVFEVHPIAPWLAAGALVLLIMAVFWCGWLQGQAATRRSVSQLPWIHPSHLT